MSLRKCRPIHFALFATALSLLASGTAAAVEPTEMPSSASSAPVYDVYVTTHRDIVSAITTTRQVDREDIWEESARNLDEALVHQPSLVVRTGGEGSPRIDIRGLRTRQILTLIDGVPFYTSQDDTFDPSLIPSQIIDHVDITYSNSSVLYGDGPIAGIIQIHTRSGEEGIHAETLGDFRSGSQFLGQGSVAGAYHGVEGFAAGRYINSNGWDLPNSFNATPLENGGRRNNSDRDQANAFAKLGYVFNEKGRADALFNYVHAEYGVPWRVEQQTDYVGRARFERVDPLEGVTGQLSGQYDVTKQVSLRSWGFVNRQVEDRSGYDNQDLDTQLMRNAFDLKGTTLVSGGAIHGRYDAGKFGTLRIAANGRYEQFESDGRIRDVNLGGGNFGFRDIDEKNSLGAWSIAAEYEVKPIEPVGLVLGYGHAFLDGQQNVSDNAFLFLGGAYVDFPTGTRLRASAAHKLRFPSLEQLYAVDGGNLDLESERCWCYEVGISQQIGPNTRFGVTGYWLEVHDFIERDETTNIYDNRQDLQSRGVEVELMSNPWKTLVLQTAYTYLDAHDRSSGSQFDRLDNRPRHKFDAEARYTFPTQTGFRIAMSFYDDILIYSRTAPLRTDHLNSFAILDVRLDQALLSNRMRVYFGVDNVTDEESEINVAFPQPGRSYYGGVDFRF